MRNIKTILILSLCLFLLVCTIAALGNAQKQKLPNQIGTFVEGSPTIKERIYNNRSAPTLRSITIDPEIPVAGKHARIAVEIAMDSPASRNEIEHVEVLYSISRGTECRYSTSYFISDAYYDFPLDDIPQEDRVQCEVSWHSTSLTSVAGKTWTGELPVFESGDIIHYAVSATDTSGNSLVTIPCETEFFPWFFLRYVETDCVHENKNGGCGDALPRGCFMKIAHADDVPDQSIPMGEFTDELKRDMNIMDARAAFDDECLFIDIAVEGDIASGRAYPINFITYIALIMNPEIDNLDGWTLDRAIGTLFYSKMSSAAFLLAGVDSCHHGFNKGIDYEQDTDTIECYVEGNHLLYIVNRDILGNDQIEQIKIMLSAGAITSLGYDWNMYHTTPITNILLSEEHVFTVQ